MTGKDDKVKVHKRYPLSSVLIYNGTTILHFVLGGVGIYLGYRLSMAAFVFGSLYLLFAFAQMYIIMPLKVCPNCVYYRMNNSRCISGLNVFSRKIAPEGNLDDFPNRGVGVLCHNNLYMAALILPIVDIIPALIINFSFMLLVVFLLLIGLLVFRIFVIFPKIACIYCCAKKECPNAKSMGLS